MAYEESTYWFSVEKKEKKNIVVFNVLGLFMAKKYNLSEKNVSVCHAPLPLPWNAKFVPHLQPSP
jgi:hypothetical protein